MDKFLQDLRYAVRSLRRQPSFALTAILTLALGIGATTAIFSVVNAVILRPLPFPEAHRIVAIQNFWTERGAAAESVSAPDFHDWKAQSTSFEAMGYYTGGEWSVTVDGVADYVMAFRITPGFLEALRARAAVGRLFTEQELRAEGPLSVVITDSYWKRQFEGRADVIGRTMKFDDRVFTIIGVLGPNVRFPIRAEFYSPASLRSETQRGAHNYRALARLKDGVSLDQAQLEMTAIAKRLEAEYPASNKGKLVAVVPLQEVVVGNIRQTLYVLFAAVGVVLLIACANVANLLLARASMRTREMVVRSAVGASHARLVRQLLTESAVLGITAALLGAWFARLATTALVALAPSTLPQINQVSVDLVALGFALLVSVSASMIFGLAPALQLSRVQLAQGLRQAGKGSAAGGRTGLARSAFVIAEVALALVLVVGAGLLGRSLAALVAVDMGFDAEQLLVLRTAVPVLSFKEASRATDFYRDLLTDVRTIPGVEAAAGVTSLPTQVRSNGAFRIEGAQMGDFTVRSPQAVLNVITPDYFRTLRVPMRRGRDFIDSDRRGAPMVAIINEALARAHLGDADPIGRRIQCGLDSLDFMTIVGVTADVRTSGPALPATPEIYMPFEQHPGPATSMNILARSTRDNPLALAETIRRRVATRNADVPVKAFTMEGTLDTASETPRFRTVLLVAFAAVALVLAVAGIYGVMSYTVTQRIPELGVRIALGAAPSSILGLVLRQGAVLAAAGVAVGLALSLMAGRFMEGLLFGVDADDPLILGAVTLAVASATLAACLIPGRRAVRVDPMVALRAE